ncbi:hypothetical protein AK825_08725 [Psychrobacter sp. P11G5]|nr:hypothetical protein AK825_08725 [Psychrobacter sp. P11G5]
MFMGYQLYGSFNIGIGYCPATTKRYRQRNLMLVKVENEVMKYGTKKSRQALLLNSGDII